jgi:hypothetical protein
MVNTRRGVYEDGQAKAKAKARTNQGLVKIHNELIKENELLETRYDYLLRKYCDVVEMNDEYEEDIFRKNAELNVLRLQNYMLTNDIECIFIIIVVILGLLVSYLSSKNMAGLHSWF